MTTKSPFVFVGSSSEGLDAARAVQQNLEHDCEVQLWNQGVFTLSQTSIEDLLEAVKNFDFAVLIITPDDLVESRGESRLSPRDNVIFELGLFIGGLGRSRTFLVLDRSADLKIPTDMAGITSATYRPPESGTWPSALGTACAQIQDAIKKVGVLSDPQNAH